MEAILDCVRQIVKNWTKTQVALTSDASPGNTTLHVVDNHRFIPGDHIILRDSTRFEGGLIVDHLSPYNDPTHIYLSPATPIRFSWTLSQNAVVERTMNDMFVKGIYIGDPEVIPDYPAITVNGTSKASEWFTLGSTKDRYEIEVSVYVLESTHEKGYRFLLQMIDLINRALQRNIFPLAQSYNVTSLQTNVDQCDMFIKANNVSYFTTNSRIILENAHHSQEDIVMAVWPDGTGMDGKGGTIQLAEGAGEDFLESDTSLIAPQILIFNSWPTTTEYGKIHKRELLKAGVIRWFAETYVHQSTRRLDTHLK